MISPPLLVPNKMWRMRRNWAKARMEDLPQESTHLSLGDSDGGKES